MASNKVTLRLRDLHDVHVDAALQTFLFGLGDLRDMTRTTEGDGKPAVVATLEGCDDVPLGAVLVAGRPLTVEMASRPSTAGVNPALIGEVANRYISPTRRSSGTVAARRSSPPPVDRRASPEVTSNSGWNVPKSVQRARSASRRVSTNRRNGSPSRHRRSESPDHFAPSANMPKYNSVSRTRGATPHKRTLDDRGADEEYRSLQQPSRPQPAPPAMQANQAFPNAAAYATDDRTMCAVVPDWVARVLRPEMIRCWVLHSESRGTLERFHTPPGTVLMPMPQSAPASAAMMMPMPMMIPMPQQQMLPPGAAPPPPFGSDPMDGRSGRRRRR